MDVGFDATDVVEVGIKEGPWSRRVSKALKMSLGREEDRADKLALSSHVG